MVAFSIKEAGRISERVFKVGVSIVGLLSAEFKAKMLVRPSKTMNQLLSMKNIWLENSPQRQGFQ